MNTRQTFAFLSTTLITVMIGSTTAHAHVSISSGPAVANATSEVVFSVGHGCSGADTYKVVIDIPAAVTSVRPLRSDFGPPSVAKDAMGAITSVTWVKPLAEALDSDLAFYKLTLRLKTPNQPFTTLYFPVHQTCRAMNGTMSTVDWVSVPPNVTDEPAASLFVVPARAPGWNKYTVPVAMTDLSVFFKDALIVWKDSAAYSVNPNTASLIGSTAGATTLTALAAGDEVWVKY